MAITDYVTLALTLLFILNGWRLGILRSLAWPLSLLISSLITVLYFRNTYNLIESFAAGTIGLIVIRILFAILFFIFKNHLDKETKTSLISRILGSIFSLCWGGSFLTLILISITLIPFDTSGIAKVKKDIVYSITYYYTDKFITAKFPQTNFLKASSRMLQDPSHFKSIKSNPEVQALLRHRKFKKIFADKEIEDHLHEKKFMKLLTNPKILDIYEDEKLMERIVKLSTKIFNKKLEKQSKPPKNKHNKESDFKKIPSED